MWTSYVNIIYKNITCENQESSHVKSYSNLHMWTSYTELQKWWQHTNHNITCDYHMWCSHVNLICEYHMWVSYTKFDIWISHVNITYKNITYEHRWTSHTISHDNFHIWISYADIHIQKFICEYHMWTSYSETSYVNISKVHIWNHIWCVYVPKKKRTPLTTWKSFYHMWTSYVSIIFRAHAWT